VAFNLYDENGDGFLSRSELYEALEMSRGLKKADWHTDIYKQIDKIMHQLDENKDGQISWDEFHDHVKSDPNLIECEAPDTFQSQEE